MYFGFSGFTTSNDRGRAPQKNHVRSWTVYVFDSSRNDYPRAWPAAVFRLESDARATWENLRAKYAHARNLHFYMEASEGEPRGVVQYFERKFGPCPQSLRVEVPQAIRKAGAGS